MKKYNIGLDVGTTSVGWAVVNAETNKLIRKGKKNLWGVSLFDEASTAEKTREYRSTRKRYDRRRKRIKLLQKEFQYEINKIDKDFFKKMKESFYNEKDTINKTIKISNNERKQYQEYSKKYPTIYHTRQQIINSNDKVDLRLVYLAIHHIIKYRGNFLYEGQDFSINKLNIGEQLKNALEDIYNLCDEINFDETYILDFDYEKFNNTILIDSKNDRKVTFKDLFSKILPNNFGEMVKLLIGDKFDISKLFGIELEEKLSISFRGTDFDDKYDDLEKILGDKIEVLNDLKDLYSMMFLKQLFKGSNESNISSLMISRYNEHKEDLKFLKSILKNNKQEYNKFFKNSSEYKKKLDNKKKCIYEKYISNNMIYDDFKKEINKSIIKIFDNFNNVELSTKYINYYREKIENGNFMPRITDTDNGKYPFQLNKDELIKIIKSQGKYYPFLLEKVDGTYKLVKLLEFRIPYYVGPLNNTSDNGEKNKNAWAIRNKEYAKEIITPYNFDKVIDRDASAEEFIKRMISHCTYMFNEYAMPANSIKYSKFKLRNELKQIKVNGEKLTKETENLIFNDLFIKTNKNITDSIFKKFLLQSNLYDNKTELKITGYSSEKGFANNMKSYYDFFGDNGFFKDTNYNIEDAEKIIEWITIFEDKSILERKIRKEFINLNDQKIKKILKLKYTGWSSLCEKLLTTPHYLDKSSQTKKSILDLLNETDENFMQILNNQKYKFQKMIDEENKIVNIDKLDYSVVEKLTTSPANKKGIYQTLKIVEEIVDYMGYEPINIILEMARDDDVKKRKSSKLDFIKKLYMENKSKIFDYKNLTKELNKIENELQNIDSTRMFLYFIQEGKCLYTGTKLDIDNLKAYEIDHILPQTLIKDNSIDNKALVLKKCNQVKGAYLVLPSIYRTPERTIWWNSLKDKGLISPTKLYRLTRKEYSVDDINGFINRQLVETRQITKHVANIINNYHPKSNVLYINAGLSHSYREKFDLYKFRDLNDYHHAHDAYLAAVLGNYRVNFFKDSIDFEKIKEITKKLINEKKYKEFKYGYVVNSLSNDAIAYDKETGEIKFDADEFNNIVKNTLYQNDIIISKKPEFYTGQFYQQTKNKKGGNGVPLKDNLDTKLYGAYTSLQCSYLVLVEYNKKKKLIGIPYIIDVKSKKNKQIKEDYIKEHLGLKNNQNYYIIKDNIPFNTLIKLDNHNVRIKGYSIASKNSEVANDIQFKIKKQLQLKWNNSLNYIFNNYKNSDIDDEIYNKDFNEIIVYIINDIKKNYPLYISIADKLISNIKIDQMTIENKKQLIKELCKMIKANSANANLKFLNTKGFDDRVGRLNGKNITSGTIIYQSYTGLYSRKYEF